MENFVYNSNDGTIKFYTSHFSIFVIFGGIEEKNLDIKNIKFYPNPFKIKEHRRCVFSNFSEDINSLSINIYDISGKFLKHFEIKDLEKILLLENTKFFEMENQKKGIF